MGFLEEGKGMWSKRPLQQARFFVTLLYKDKPSERHKNLDPEEAIVEAYAAFGEAPEGQRRLGRRHDWR